MWTFGSSVEADMNQAEEALQEYDAKSKAKTDRVRAARQAVFEAYMRDEDKPSVGRFADPRAAMMAGRTGR